MVELFTRKIGIAYPFPRYAQICVADFIFGGMENTSATTLTEQILFDERSEADYRRVAESLIAHELAHQWWGDLVT
jgi:aminopeptidase N